MLEGVSSMVSLVKFYVDDAAPHVSLSSWRQKEGPKYGYKIKATKGNYLVKVWESYQAAQVRKQHLMQVVCSSP
jgi:hypothetical protein